MSDNQPTLTDVFQLISGLKEEVKGLRYSTADSYLSILVCYRRESTIQNSQIS